MISRDFCKKIGLGSPSSTIAIVLTGLAEEVQFLRPVEVLGGRGNNIIKSQSSNASSGKIWRIPFFSGRRNSPIDARDALFSGKGLIGGKNRPSLP
jgi:hypothetical protein